MKKESTTPPKITESIVRAGAAPQSFQRWKEYCESGAVSNTAIQGSVLSGECAGTYSPYYSVRVTLDRAGIQETTCTCPYEYGGYCKHIVALLLMYVHHPKQFAIRKEPEELLAELDREDLAALLTRLLREKPDLSDWVEASLAVPSAKSKTGKKKRREVDVEVYRRQIAGIMHSLDGMRMSEAYWQVGGLTLELREVQDAGMKFLDAGDATTALAILLLLLEESSRGIEFLDDSNGELGDFVGSLGTPLDDPEHGVEPGRTRPAGQPTDQTRQPRRRLRNGRQFRHRHSGGDQRVGGLSFRPVGPAESGSRD